MDDSLRSLKVHQRLPLGYHWLSLVTTHGVGDNRDLKFNVYFEVFFALYGWMV